ncbi:MAG: RES family NAD+ phosphorylase [Dokdonella sp.]
MVEAQNRVSTLRLVDTLAEQTALENMLEASKPPLPLDCIGLHWLLATPFRYPAPPPIGSRFRAIGDPGVWYCATALRTAFAEVGYWRQRFLLDSPSTPDLPPVAHTAFRASIGGNGVVLFEPPFARDSAKWESPNDYSATQALAQTARTAEIAIIRYRSVRDPQHSPAFAVLTPRAFRKHEPIEQHGWLLKVTRASVLAQAGIGAERYEFTSEELGSRERRT